MEFIKKNNDDLKQPFSKLFRVQITLPFRRQGRQPIRYKAGCETADFRVGSSIPIGLPTQAS